MLDDFYSISSGRKCVPILVEATFEKHTLIWHLNTLSWKFCCQLSKRFCF